MSVIVRLQNLPWAANAVDIRQYFHGLSIPEGGVHIVGGELGDAFIAFSTDEDARQAMLRDGGKVKDITVKLYLSSRAEMQKIIDQARQQSLGMQQFMSMPTMAPISVPVTTITVPNIPVPSVSIPNVQSVQAMQVPLQNVAAMVTNMAKHDPVAITRPAPAVTGVVQEHSDNKSVVSSNVSVKSDTDKDKKDKRRRRTRSHSRESSNSRTDSRSRSRSRSSSRSRDRKGRDRHYDRRRKRSRSRDRRRRRDRSRSRERSHRDRRKDYNRHGSREEFDDNNQSSRWNNPAQRNRQNKPRTDFYNRDQQNQNRNNYQQKPNIPKGGSNEPTKPSFTNNNLNQSNINEVKGPLPTPIHPKDDSNLSRPSLPVVPSSSGPALPTSSSLPPNSQNLPTPQNIGSSSQNPVPTPQNPNTNFYGDLPPPPMFNPQHMVSYPSYNPSGIPQFNMFPPMPPQQLNPSNIQQDMSSKQEMDSKMDFIGGPRNSPLIHPSGTDLMANLSNKFDTEERGSKSRFGNEMAPNEIPLPSSDKIQSSGGNSGWGFKDSNYSYGNKETTSGSDKREPFNSGWGNVSSSNSNSNNKSSSSTFNKKITNTCVQIKNVPDHTKHDDIRGFFRNNQINAGCLKVVGDEHGRVNGVFVKFNSVGDKKKAICRSGCLLNNSIVTVLHADDKEFNSAKDLMEEHHPYWIPGGDEMNKDVALSRGSGIMMNNDIKNASCCIKFQGDLRYHPFFTSKHKVHPHIKSLCDKFDPIDICVVQSRGMHGLDAFMKFESNSYAEAALQSLSNVKVDGKPIVVTNCSNEEFVAAKANCIAMDVQNFLRTVKNLPSNFDNPNIKQDDRIDPRLQSSSYSDRRSKPNDHNENDSLDNDVDMKTSDDEPEPEFKRSNKVLLPTPSPMLQLPLLKDGSHSNCVLMQNLPLQANDHEIINFFSDIGVVPTQIHIMLDSNGKQYGDAYCEFDKTEEAATASSKDGSLIGKNNVRVCSVSRQEMSNALGLFVSTSGPNNMGGPPQGGPFFNGPPGPPLFGNNMRMDVPRMGGNDWIPPMFNPAGGPMNSNPNFNNMNTQGDRGYRQGGRGGFRGRGDGDFGGRGSRGSRGGGLDRGGRGRGGEIGSRGGRGGESSGRGSRGIETDSRGGRGSESSNRGLGRGGNMRNNENGGRGGGRGGMDGFNRGGRMSNDGGRGGRMSNMSNDGGRGGRMSNMSNDGGRGRGSRGNMRGGMSRGGRDSNNYSRNQPPDLMSLPSAPPMENQSGPPSLLPSKSVTRPIQLEEDSVREFGQTGCVVSAENVPYRAELNDILDFFGDFDLTAESIIRRYNDAGQVTGDARIAFKSPSDAKRAIKYLNKQTIGNRKVNLTLFK